MGVEFFAEGGADAAAIFHERLHAPVNVADVVPADGAGEVELVHHFCSGASGVFGGLDAGGGDTGPDGAGALGAPPVEEAGEALFAIDAPVELGGEIVAPAVLEPLTGVCREVFVGIDVGGGTGGDAGPPDAEGADADAHPGFAGFHGAIHLTDKGVDVATALSA